MVLLAGVLNSLFCWSLFTCAWTTFFLGKEPWFSLSNCIWKCSEIQYVSISVQFLKLYVINLVWCQRFESKIWAKIHRSEIFLSLFSSRISTGLYGDATTQNFLYRRTTFSVNRSRFQHQTSTDASFRFCRNCKCVSDRKVAGICFENSKHDTPCFLFIFYFHIGFSICIFQLKNKLIAFWVYKIMNEKNKFSIIQYAENTIVYLNV